MEEKIRILLVDDHAIVRQGLRALLDREPDMEVVGEACNGQEGIEYVARLHPDVVVMDIVMPGMDGITATRRVKDADPHSKVLVLTMHAEARYLLPVIEAGGSGYVLKSATHEELSNAVRIVSRGDVFLHPEITPALIKQMLSQRPIVEEQGGPKLLSERERLVLALVAQGYTSGEIAERLSVSPKTVDSYRERIMRKLGFRQRSELVRYALSQGLLRPADG